MPLILIEDVPDPKNRALLVDTKSPDDRFGLIVVGRRGNEVKYFIRGSAKSEAFQDFSDMDMEDPLVFKKLKTAERHRDEWNQFMSVLLDVTWHVAFWVHPEAGYLAVAKHQLTTGWRFPGSPRH